MSVTMTMAAKRPNPKFAGAIVIRCPRSLEAAAARAADRTMTNVSAYVRGALLERLARDGITLVEEDDAMAGPRGSAMSEAPA
jgi:hypothetical protein